MPFKSAAQESYMMHNLPGLWKEWVAKYGHHPDFKAKSRKSKRRRGRKKSVKRRRKKR